MPISQMRELRKPAQGFQSRSVVEPRFLLRLFILGASALSSTLSCLQHQVRLESQPSKCHSRASVVGKAQGCLIAVAKVMEMLTVISRKEKTRSNGLNSEKSRF